MDYALGANGNPAVVARELLTARYYWSSAERRAARLFDALWSHDDDAATAVAKALLDEMTRGTKG
jgi:hypothetical protein